MDALVLVAYATRYGSTADTARRLAEFLQKDGIQTEVRAVDQVKELRPYSAIVLAAALYIGRLHKDARRFLATWHVELVHLPVVLMVPGPVEPEQKQFTAAKLQLEKELARIPWFHPIAQTVVGGKWDPAKLSFPFNLTLRKVPASDARDWDAIGVWAHEIAGKLHPQATR